MQGLAPRTAIEKARPKLATRPAPALGVMWEDHQKAQAVFVPELAEPLPEDNNEVALYTLGDLRHLRVDLRRLG